jgi:hypothetical protein
MTPKKTLGEFIIDNQNQFEYSTGELSRLLNAIRLASKAVNHEVNKAGFEYLFGDFDIAVEEKWHHAALFHRLCYFYSCKLCHIFCFIGLHDLMRRLP